jgi:hypothetical protein
MKRHECVHSDVLTSRIPSYLLRSAKLQQFGKRDVWFGLVAPVYARISIAPRKIELLSLLNSLLDRTGPLTGTESMCYVKNITLRYQNENYCTSKLKYK